MAKRRARKVTPFGNTTSHFDKAEILIYKNRRGKEQGWIAATHVLGPMRSPKPRRTMREALRDADKIERRLTKLRYIVTRRIER